MPDQHQPQSPYEYYVLHVEDEQQYVEPLKQLAIAALQTYGIESDLVSWDVAGTKEEAVRKLADAEQGWPERGYDTVFCDLKIPNNAQESTVSIDNGFNVVEDACAKRGCGTVVVVTNFSDDPEVLDTKSKLHEQGIQVDDFLGKSRELGNENRELAIAKLRRVLIPTEKYADECKEHGALFLHATMKALLREIAYLARRNYCGWPLAKFLLLGDAGCGKNKLAEVFSRLLPESEAGLRELQSQQAEAPLYVVNCAQLVAEGHGGLIDFLGADGIRLGQTQLTQPGCFEKATYYANGKDPNGLASGRAPQPDYSRAGVVLIDEFAELHPRLQTAILNVLNEGIVRRQGRGTTVPIGCHVILATNYPREHLIGQPNELSTSGARARFDFVTRIKDYYVVPSLGERQDEIVPMIEYLAQQRIGAEVVITHAAGRMVQMAVGQDIITSIRDLETIADVESGETVITDANLRSLLRKAEVFGKRDTLSPAEGSASFEDQCDALRLPADLRSGGLPDETKNVVDVLYRRKMGWAPRYNTQNIRRHRQLGDNEQIDRFILMSHPGVIPPEFVARLYENPGGLRRARSSAYRRCGIDASGNDDQTCRQILDYLMRPPS